MVFTYPWSERALRSIKIKELGSMGRYRAAFFRRYRPFEFEVMHKRQAEFPEQQQSISQDFSKRTEEDQPSSKAWKELDVPVNRRDSNRTAVKYLNTFFNTDQTYHMRI
jgi:hypothetical protein